MSIPETLNELHHKLEKIPPALLPPCHPANQEVLSPCATESEASSNLSQRAPVTDTIPPGSACNATSGAESQLPDAIDIRAPNSLLPLCPVDAVPDCSSVSHQPEII